MLEALDIYDNYGNRTNKTVNSISELKKGEYIQIVNVYIYNKNKNFLVVNDLNSSVTTGTYSIMETNVLSKEESIFAAQRELKELTGFEVMPKDILKCGRIKRELDFIDLWFIKVDFADDYQNDKMVVINKEQLVEGLEKCSNITSEYCDFIKRAIERIY